MTKAGAAAVTIFKDAGGDKRRAEVGASRVRAKLGQAEAEAGGGMLTVQHEERKKWVLELLEREQVADEMTIRVT